MVTIKDVIFYEKTFLYQDTSTIIEIIIITSVK